MTHTYMLKGIPRSGNSVYYTGRAGELWISILPRKAFEYETREAAQRKAAQFNVMTPIHGITWSVIETH